MPLRRYRPRAQVRLLQRQVTRSCLPCVDAHTHLGRWLTAAAGQSRTWAVPDVVALIGLMDRLNLAALVNFDGRWADELEANLDRYDRAHPGRFATFCHVDWGEATCGGFTERLVASLRRSVRAGAKGLKIWKDLGLHVRDGSGALLLPDDARLDPLWTAAGELGVPVAIHTADPVAFFDPVDERNERLEELLENPDWSFVGPDFPPFARLMDALEALVAAHPDTSFIALHVGGFAENLAWVGRMLDTYPNLSIDIAGRLAELGRQPRTTRALFMRHADRVLFGTDTLRADPESYATHFRFLETADEHFPYSSKELPPQGRWAISGIELPEEILKRIYFANAKALLPSIA